MKVPIQDLLYTFCGLSSKSPTDPQLVINNELPGEIEKIFDSVGRFEKTVVREFNYNRFIVSHYRKILTKWVDGVEEALIEEGYVFDVVIEAWIKKCEEQKISLVIDSDEILDSEKHVVFLRRCIF